MDVRAQENRHYVAPEVDTARVESLSRELGVSRIIAHLLVLRGVDTVELAEEFLAPSLDRDWLDPFVIPGMAQATAALTDAVMERKHIVVFGDFDADGISATAVLTRGLREFGALVTPVIPRRLDEGYGLSTPALERIMSENPDVVVTVDNGISAADEVEIFKERGVEVIITDHHEPGDKVPFEVPVVDPKMDEACPSRDLAGVGVALKVVQALGPAFDKPDFWRTLTDIATIGTVGDQMPLVGENRALVFDGIRRMNENPSPAIVAFMATSTRTEELTADGISFSLLPRLNSAGRMGDAAVALDLLLSADYDAAYACMTVLEEVNNVRRQTEAECTASALEQAALSYRDERAVVLASTEWHEGVKGIVASRIVGHYGVPTLLFSVTEDGIAHGSGRSIGSVNLFKAVAQCQDLLVRFGGHAAAVGVTLEIGRLEEFKERLCAVLDTLPEEQFVPLARVDMQVALEEVDLALVEDLGRLAPFGQDNRLPVFIVRNLFMENRRTMGNPPAHFSCTATNGKTDIRGIYFHPRNLEELTACDTAVDMVFRAEKNEFRGNCSVQLMIKDIVILADEEIAEQDTALFDSFLEDVYCRCEECLDHGDYAGILDAPSFHTKVAGVTFEGRQGILAKLAAPCDLELIREPSNEYDSSAVAVLSCEGKIGYLNSRLAQKLAPALDAGASYEVLLTELTGGQEERSLGANILICRAGSRETERQRLESLLLRKEEWSRVSEDELSGRIQQTLIGDRELHSAQRTSLDLLAAGKNVLTVMATGRGKSLIFHMHAALAALKYGKASIFIYPLRALVADQSYHLQEVFEAFGLQVRVLTGESVEDERDEVFEGLASGQIDCVLTTPEFLSIHSKRFADTGRIGFLVVDEAHHVGMARAGHRAAYGNLGVTLAELGNPVVLAVTATAKSEVARKIIEDLKIDETVLDDTLRSNLSLEDERDVRDRNARLAHLVATGEKTVIYVNSREQSIQLARMLRKAVPAQARGVAFYNAGLARTDRQRIEGAFRDGQLNVVISTSAFGEGVNIPDVRNVVLYHLPFNAIEFNQMAGRCGRDGAPAKVYLLFGIQDARINERILSAGAPTRNDMITLYRVLRSFQRDVGAGEPFSATNAALAEACRKLDAKCALQETAVSCGIQVFRDLGLLQTRRSGAARDISLLDVSAKVDLESSVRYLEGAEEILEFQEFKEWVFTASSEELLGHFNRPILPW